MKHSPHPIAAEIGELIKQANMTYTAAVELLPAELRLRPDTLSGVVEKGATPHRDTEAKLERLAGALRLRIAGERPPAAKLTRLPQNGLYRTELAGQFLGYLDYAWKNRASHIWLFTGIWGSGKSSMGQYAKQHLKQYPVFYSETPPHATPAELVNTLHAALALPPVPVSYRRREAIVEELRKHPRLLLIDQAEELTIAALNTLQYLWDRSRCCVVLLASPFLISKLLGARSGQNLQRLRTRLSHIALPAASPEEVAAIVGDVCGARPWGPGAFSEFYLRTGSGCLRQVLAGAQAVNQVMEASGRKKSDAVTSKALEVALRHLL